MSQNDERRISVCCYHCKTGFSVPGDAVNYESVWAEAERAWWLVDELGRASCHACAKARAGAAARDGRPTWRAETLVDGEWRPAPPLGELPLEYATAEEADKILTRRYPGLLFKGAMEKDKNKYARVRAVHHEKEES